MGKNSGWGKRPNYGVRHNDGKRHDKGVHHSVDNAAKSSGFSKSNTNSSHGSHNRWESNQGNGKSVAVDFWRNTGTANVTRKEPGQKTVTETYRNQSYSSLCSGFHQGWKTKK
ncbi:unnamed protein product [Amoebophrya sp. A25]|nr:unnamed protein product [Amoebophrya sp. A25]|eukprot:GSA25T00015634001.1